MFKRLLDLLFIFGISLSLLIIVLVENTFSNFTEKPGSEIEIILSNSEPMTFCYIPAGSFQMGSTNDEKDHRVNEAPLHAVTITRPFWLGKYEVTQKQWTAVMGDNPSVHSGENRPVDSVSWHDCVVFIDRINQDMTQQFRLPTEAEWEYACRAGTSSRFYWTDDNTEDDASKYGWTLNIYSEETVLYTHPVGKKIPNALNLYDMIGNVAEWCEDWYSQDYYSRSPVIDPLNNEHTGDKIYRGGGWCTNNWNARSARRDYFKPNLRSDCIGFRLVMEIE